VLIPAIVFRYGKKKTEHLCSLVLIYYIKVSATVSITNHMKDSYKNSYMNSVFSHVKKAKLMFKKEL